MHAGLEPALQRLAGRGWLELEPMEWGAVRVRLGGQLRDAGKAGKAKAGK